jgi:hypothetical protein
MLTVAVDSILLWSWFWTICFALAAGGFLWITLTVLVYGFADLKAMLRNLRG